MNDYDWPEDQYDLVIANGALHHLSGVESVIKGIYRSLKKGGVLYACEVVGAQWQNHQGRQLELINALAYLVPPKLRRSRRTTPLGYLKDAIAGRLTLPSVKPHWSPFVRFAHRTLSGFAAIRGTRPSKNMPMLWEGNKAWLLRSDPSEGVSSDRILPAIQSIFPEPKVLQFGGSLLAYALDENFYRNYDAANQSHAQLLRQLTLLEAQYIAAGEVPVEHALIVATK